VNGLNLGAPVKLKGVNIGTVTNILVQYDNINGRVLTPVLAQVDLKKVTDIRGNPSTPDTTRLDELVQRGLRARLALQSLVTGQLYVDVNFYPEKPIRNKALADLGYPEIPSIPSSSEEIENTIDEAIAEIRKLPIQQTFTALLHSIEHIEHLLGAPETQSSLVLLHEGLQDLRGLIGHLEKRIDPLAGSLDLTLKTSQNLARNLDQNLAPLMKTTETALNEAAITLVQTRKTLTNLESATDRQSSLDETLRQLTATARSLRELTESLERDPQQLIFGKGRGEEK
jgi:paraquat-inducible protein B